MRISRLYLPVALAQGKKITLDDESAHYLRTVLRLKKDSGIVLFNGEGGEYSGTVAAINRKTVLIAIDRWSSRSVESPLRVTLGLGIARGDRMDISVQKTILSMENFICSAAGLDAGRNGYNVLCIRTYCNSKRI